MFKNNNINIGIFIGILIVFIITLFIVIYLVNKMKEDMIFNPRKRNMDNTLKIQKYSIDKLLKNKNLTFKNRFVLIGKDKININIIKNNKSDKWILYCHGNSGDIYSCYKYFYKLSKISSIFCFDYRGYGLSTNKPSVKNIKEDVIYMWYFLVNNLKIDPQNIIVLGISLGGAISIYLGEYLSINKKKLPKAIISESSFSSVIDIAKYRFPLVSKLSFFLTESFNSKKSLSNINKKVPVIICHSDEDDYVPITHAQTLLKSRSNTHFFRLYGEHDKHFVSKKYLDFISSLF